MEIIPARMDGPPDPRGPTSPGQTIGTTSGSRLSEWPIPSEVSRFWFGRSLEFIRQEPLTYLKLLLRKLYLFWNGYEIESNKDLYFFRRYSLVLRGLLWRYGLSFPFGLIAPLALTGILLSLRERRNVGLLYLFVGSYVLSVILFFVTARYRIPVIPFLILFGAYALYWIYRTARAGRYRELALPLCCTVLFALISNSRLYGATDSDSARMHGLVGTIYAQQGLYDKAIAEFRAAVTRDPDSPKPHCFLGMIYRKIGAYGAAADAYRAALKIRPDYTAARCDLALIYREEGLYREAAAEYRAALRFSPGDVEARHNLAEIYYLQKLYDRARTEYEKVLEITPNVGSGVYYRLGVIYDKLGDHAQAARRYRKAIEIDPGDVRSYYGLGLIYHRTDRSEEAVELYRRAARIDPDRGRAHFNLGTLYDRQGLHREAMSAYERALRFRPDMAEAYVRLGILYSRDDRTGKAAEMFRRALEIDPNDERARAYLDASLNRSP